MVVPGTAQERKRRLENELRVFMDRWSRDPSIKKIILFGSVARGPDRRDVAGENFESSGVLHPFFATVLSNPLLTTGGTAVERRQVYTGVERGWANQPGRPHNREPRRAGYTSLWIPDALRGCSRQQGAVPAPPLSSRFDI